MRRPVSIGNGLYATTTYQPSLLEQHRARQRRLPVVIPIKPDPPEVAIAEPETPWDKQPPAHKTIPCPDCIDGFDPGSHNFPAPCGTCAGYRTILAPEEVERTKLDKKAMQDQADYDLKRRMMGKAKNAELKPMPEYLEGTGGRFAS